MPTELLVINPFRTYAAGDRITEPGAIQDILATGNAHHVVKVASRPAADAAPAQLVAKPRRVPKEG